MKCSKHNLISVCELTLIFLVDFLQDFIKRALLLGTLSTLLLCRNILSIHVFQLNGAFKGLLKLVILQLQFPIQIHWILLVNRKQSNQITEEKVFLVHILIKHTNHLSQIAIPSDEASAKSSELIAFFRILQVISIGYRLQNTCHFAHRGCVLFTRFIPNFNERNDIILIVDGIIQELVFGLINQIYIHFLLQASLLIERLEGIQNIFFLIYKIENKGIHLTRTGSVQS